MDGFLMCLEKINNDHVHKDQMEEFLLEQFR